MAENLKVVDISGAEKSQPISKMTVGQFAVVTKVPEGWKGEKLKVGAILFKADSIMSYNTIIAIEDGKVHIQEAMTGVEVRISKEATLML